MAPWKSDRLGDGVSPRVMSEFDFMVVDTMDLKLAVSLRRMQA